MKVYVVMQSEGKRVGQIFDSKRVRGVFSSKAKAEKYVGPQDTRPTIKCDCCNQQKPNPAYNFIEAWKEKLSIHEWNIQ